MGLAGLLDRAEESGKPARGQVRLAERREAVVEDVELHPHLGRDQRPQCARILSRIADRAYDRRWIGGIDHVEFHDALRRGRRVGSKETLLVRIQLDNRPPVLSAMTVAGEGLIDVEDARKVLSTLDIARQPEDAVREAGEENVTQRPRCPSSRRPARN